MITYEPNRPPIELDGLLRRALRERVVDAKPSRRVRADVLRAATIVRAQSPGVRERAAWSGWTQTPPLPTHALVRMDVIRAQFDWVRLLL